MELVNYNDHIKEDENTAIKQPYPNESTINIKLPMRMLIDGPSGSAKSTLMLNLIKMIGMFDHIVLLAKDLEEELYQHLIKVYAAMDKKLKITEPTLLAINSIKDLPSVDSFSKKCYNLLIVDDMMTEKEADLAKITAFWIRGRKRGVSSVFISQSYYKIPINIRSNCDYVILKKLNTSKDIRGVLKEYNGIGVSTSDLEGMYDFAMSTKNKDPKGESRHIKARFFMIDNVTERRSLKFRANFDPLLEDEK